MRIDKIELEYDNSVNQVKVRSKDSGYGEKIGVVLILNGNKNELHFEKPSNEWSLIECKPTKDNILMQVEISSPGRDSQNYTLSIAPKTGEISYSGEVPQKSIRSGKDDDLNETKYTRRSEPTRTNQFLSGKSLKSFEGITGETPEEEQSKSNRGVSITKEDMEKIQPLLSLTDEEFSSLTLLIKSVNFINKTTSISKGCVEVLLSGKTPNSKNAFSRLLEVWLNIVSSDSYFKVFTEQIYTHQNIYKSLNAFHSALFGLVEELMKGEKQEDQIAGFFKDQMTNLKYLAESLLKIRQFTEDQKYIDFIEKYLTSYFVTREAVKSSDGA